MSSESPQEQAAGENQTWQASLARQLASRALPELGGLMGPQGLSGMLAGRDASGMMAMDRDNLASSLAQLRQGYGQAQNVGRESLAYQGLRSGVGRTNPGAVSSAITSAATGLARDQAAAERNLQFMSAQSSMGDFNKVLALMGQGSQTALSLSGGMGRAATSAIGGLSTQTQMGNTIGGASTGASLGSMAGPWGALIGAVAGGAAGYVTSE